jgi:hypothetical protein
MNNTAYIQGYMQKEALSPRIVFNAFRSALQAGASSPRLARYRDMVKQWTPRALQRAQEAYTKTIKGASPETMQNFTTASSAKNMAKLLKAQAKPTSMVAENNKKLLPFVEFNASPSQVGQGISRPFLNLRAYQQNGRYTFAPSELFHELGHTVQKSPRTFANASIMEADATRRGLNIARGFLSKDPMYGPRMASMGKSLNKALETYKIPDLLSRMDRLTPLRPK